MQYVEWYEGRRWLQNSSTDSWILVIILLIFVHVQFLPKLYEHIFTIFLRYVFIATFQKMKGENGYPNISSERASACSEDMNLIYTISNNINLLICFLLVVSHSVSALFYFISTSVHTGSKRKSRIKTWKVCLFLF